MKYWNLSISELSEKTGLTVSGLKHMMKYGSFKMDSLSKICKAFHIHPVVLFADTLEVFSVLDEESEVIDTEIRWMVNDKSEDAEPHKAFPDLKGGVVSCINALWIKLHNETTLMADKIELLEDTIVANKKMIETQQKQLEDKIDIIEYAKQENLFAYANLISAMSQNRTSGGNMSPDQLSDMAKSRIFDPVFLRKLLDQSLISEADYQFFISSITKKK